MSSEIFESIKKQAANVSPFNAKLKFILDDEVILIDGSDGASNIVTTDDVDADTVIICEKETTGKIGMNKKYSNGFYTFKQAMLMALFTR